MLTVIDVAFFPLTLIIIQLHLILYSYLIHCLYSHLVGPLSYSYALAGFFPGKTPSGWSRQDMDKLQDDEDNYRDREDAYGATMSNNMDWSSIYTNNNQQDSDNGMMGDIKEQTKYWVIEDKRKLNSMLTNSIQTINLRNNFLFWDAKSKLDANKIPSSQVTTANSDTSEQVCLEEDETD